MKLAKFAVAALSVAALSVPVFAAGVAPGADFNLKTAAAATPFGSARSPWGGVVAAATPFGSARSPWGGISL